MEDELPFHYAPNSDLVGIWYSPGGGWNGYALIFRPDGTARAEMSNLFLTNVWTFDWKFEDSKLIVTGRETIELNAAQDGVTHRPWRIEARLAVAFGLYEAGEGEPRRTLTLENPLEDCLPVDYIAGNPNYDLFAEPDFSGWIERSRDANDNR